MFSVALLGPDGAGKTTIGHLLQEWPVLRLKYIYMGINIEASNYALPTSRFVEYLRRRQHRNSDPFRAESQLFEASKNEKPSVRAKLWAASRLANRLAEEWYRQLLSWAYQARGYIVLYDRHFLFDFSLDDIDPNQQGFDERLHRWFLTHLYPRPNLVIYLDAPAQVLFARKGEKDIEELERRRKAYIRQIERSPNFVLVDATQTLSKVYADVTNCILRFGMTRQCMTFPKQDERPGTLLPDALIPDGASKPPR